LKGQLPKLFQLPFGKSFKLLKTATSYPLIKTGVMNAGAKWEGKEVVVDQALITGRRPDDFPTFCAKMKEIITTQFPDARHLKKIRLNDSLVLMGSTKSCALLFYSGALLESDSILHSRNPH
jgi:hypothetical protein